ncbi:hypothetical protein [Marinilactibacillus kalidii]|uniref:hypothetical protein n=1 Tax=Marinilactibacillus kalidii TaxID=2820274 RepID=UPI001ABE2555|nr:hypothetical protein [Marinilactibacillus kalidii]
MKVKILEVTYRKMKVLTLMLASGVVLAACSTDDNATDEMSDADETTEETSDAAMDTEEDETEASGGAQGAMSDTLDGVKTLTDGEYVVGEDLPAGRYEITGKEPGNLLIENNDDRNTNILEILEDGSMNMGVPSVTTDLTDGTKIALNDLEETRFEPVSERTLSNVLSTGTWEVGKDIEPGSYEVTTNSDKSGKIMVYEGLNALPIVDSPIDPEGELGPESLEVELEEGQEVIVSVSPELEFAPK